MKSLIGRSAVIASALLLGLIIFSAQPSIADTPFSQFQQQKPDSKQELGEALGKAEAPSSRPRRVTSSTTGPGIDGSDVPQSSATSVNYVATAYSLRGRTASGRMVSRGLIAADPRFLPLGSRVRLDHPGYSGEYLVADTGGMIKGKRIDIWTPSTSEAMRFGRRTVKLTVLSYPPKRVKRTAKA
jgi:3D (Asp-Asp-Asp) domain-containing protein